MHVRKQLLSGIRSCFNPSGYKKIPANKRNRSGDLFKNLPWDFFRKLIKDYPTSCLLKLFYGLYKKNILRTIRNFSSGISLVLHGYCKNHPKILQVFFSAMPIAVASENLPGNLFSKKLFIKFTWITSDIAPLIFFFRIQ